jgi:uncharacterized Tic20 family protein
VIPADDDPRDPLLRDLPAGDPPPRPVRDTTPGDPPVLETYFALDEGPLKPREERVYAALAHLSQLAGIVVAPMLLLATLGPRSLYVDSHAKEAFNHQITMVIAFVVAVVVALRGAGPGVLGIVVAYGAVLAGFAALRSMQGAYFRYPLALRLLR